MYQCIMYQFLRRLRYLYEYILNSYFQSVAASFFDIRSQGVSKVSCTNSYVDLEIWMSILQTDSMCCWQHHFWHMNMGCCKKYCILIPTYKQKFVWAYFKQIDMIFPVLVFAYELQSPSKVCNTNSYVNMEICMTILQTASLCCWQHHFWHTNMVTFESI